MIRIFRILSVVMVCTAAIMPLNQPPSNTKKGLVHSIAKSIMEKKLKQSEHRLPCNTVPHVYIIDLDPDFLGEKFTFKGNGTIFFEVLQPTTTVTIHRSDRMDIDKHATELLDENGDRKKPVSQKWNPANDFFAMKFNFRLKAGNYSLKMSWTGRDGGDGWYSPHSGFFRAVDEDKNGNLKYLITTHFEPAGARQVFPCWDEPGKKAQFEFSIKHYPNYTALSNMPVKNREELSDGRILTRFERSLKMSSYLPCLAVADYKHIENKHGNITFYTLESALDSVKYALEISEKVIPAMEFYTDVLYAFPKLDQITIPQYGATAMEHWGLVSYVTHSVLVHNNTFLPDIRESEQTEMLVAHELAHQWFGNLVTPIWWNDVWLNEAFAAYFQYKVLGMIFPERRIMDAYAVERLNQQFFEANGDSHEFKPIKWNPTTKIETEDIFSQVTYGKGSAVLHMLDHMLGEEIFCDGIRRYLKAHKFMAVVTDDLWDDLQEAYDEMNKDKPLNVKETMDPWIEQTGYPIITVRRDDESGDVILKQKNAALNSPNNKWNIPINYATKSNPDFSSSLPTIWFNKDDDNVTISNIDKDDWIILNIQQRGFYQVDYDENNWRLIADYLNSVDYDKISPINRGQLITDAFKLIQGTFNQSKLEILINITSYLHRETDYLPWIPAIEIINGFNQMMQDTAVEEISNKYTLFLMNEMLDQIGDDYVGMKAQQLLFPLACKLDHVKCRKYANRVFNETLESLFDEKISYHNYGWIICAGLVDANETVWESLMKSINETEHIKLYKFLMCSKSEEVRNKYMDRIFTTNITDELSEIIEVFRQFRKNKKNVDYILNYSINHFELIEEYFEKSGDPEYVIVMIAVLDDAINTRDQFEKFKAFLEPRLETFKEKFDEPRMDTLLDELETRINTREAQLIDFHTFMDKRLSELNIIKPDKNDEKL